MVGERGCNIFRLHAARAFDSRRSVVIYVDSNGAIGSRVEAEM